MKGKVLIEIVSGDKAGEKYEYTSQERVFIGRQEDCAIIVPEKTVSRYHCMLDIMPPKVKLQDFGSLNGTFLNGEKIGQRERSQSWEEAQAMEHDEYELKDGDVLGLGKGCKLKVHTVCWETCAQCGKELEASATGDETVPEGAAGPYYNSSGRKICFACYEENRRQKEEQERKKKEAERREQLRREELERKKREEEQRRRLEEQERKKKEEELKRREQEAARLKKEKELAALAAERKRIEEEAERKRLEEEKKQREQEEKERKLREAAEALLKAELNDGTKTCKACGKKFKPSTPEAALCRECVEKQARELLDNILANMKGNAATPVVKQGEPSILEGYEKISLLGRGGMGEVWKVRETKTGKYFALKTMLPEVAADDESKKRFLREEDISKQLNHKNVVKTYKTGCVNDILYILMDLCEGGSAESLMEKYGGKLPLNLATYITLQTLSGLDYVHNMDLEVEIKAGRFRGTKEVHAKGAVHRDFKPGNIFLSDKSDHPVAMVADFGMAKAFETAGMSKNTRSGNVMGTPVFMPKQQVRNCKYAKPEVDVWAAAASYYNMLTGQFVKNFRRGKNPMMIIMSEAAMPIRERNSAIPPKLAEVIDRALQEDPVIGYSSAAEFRRDLIKALPPEVYSYCKDVIK